MNKDFADDALRTLAKRRAPAWAQALLFVLATAVFTAFAYHARYARLDEFAAFRLEELTRFTAGVFTVLYAVTLLVQLRIGRKMPLGAQVLLSVLVGAILLAKISLLDYVSDDYDIFLSNWIYEYSEMGIKEGLGTYIASDYSSALPVHPAADFPSEKLSVAVSGQGGFHSGGSAAGLCGDEAGKPEDSRNRLKADDPQPDDDSADSRL